MSLAIRWTSHAADQFVDAARYLESARQGVGHAFIDAVEETLSRITAHPYANPQIPGEPQNTRKAVLADYGYWIVYEVHADAIVILTVWHAVRKPESWRAD